MPELLVVKDHQALLVRLRQRVEEKGVVAQFASSFHQAMSIIRAHPISRMISDNVFEGERERGLELLTVARALYPDADLHLLTGQPLQTQETEIAQQNRIEIVKKNAATPEIIDSMILGRPRPTVEIPAPRAYDVAQLVLENDSLTHSVAELESLNELLINDIYEELAQYPQNIPVLGVGAGSFSREQLQVEIRQKTPLGRQFIKYHQQLNSLLRKGEAT